MNSESKLSEDHSSFSEDLKKSFHYLRGELENTLTRMEERIRQQFEQYTTLKSAIENEKKELQLVHHIRASADALSKLFQETQAKKETLEAEIRDKQEKFDAEFNSRKKNLEQELLQRKEYILSELSDQKQKLETEIETRERQFEDAYTQRKSKLETEYSERKKHIEDELETLEIQTKETLQTKRDTFDKQLATERETFENWLAQERQSFENWVEDEKQKAQATSQHLQERQEQLTKDREFFEKDLREKEKALLERENTYKTEYAFFEQERSSIEKDRDRINIEKSRYKQDLQEERTAFETWKKEETYALKLRLEAMEREYSTAIQQKKEHFLQTQNLIEKRLDTLSKKEKAFSLQQHLQSQLLEQKQTALEKELALKQQSAEQDIEKKLQEKEKQLIEEFNRTKNQELDMLYHTKLSIFQKEIESLKSNLHDKETYIQKQNKQISDLESKVIQVDTEARKESQTHFQASMQTIVEEHQDQKRLFQTQIQEAQSELLQKDQELTQLLKRIEFLENAKIESPISQRLTKEFIPKIVRSSRPRT